MKNFYSLLAAGLLLSVGASAADIPGANVFIKNVNSGLYVSGGHSWGTHGIASQDADLYQVEAKGDVYGLKNLDVNATKKYFGGGYVDNQASIVAASSWKIEEVPGKGYTIFQDGAGYLTLGDALENASPILVGLKGYVLTTVAELDDNCYWQFLSADEVIAAAKAVASETNPVDLTALIRNANFSRVHNANWTVSKDCTNNNLGGGDNNNMCAESYHSPFTISQVLKNMPMGKYGFRAQGFYRIDSGDPATDGMFQVYAGDAAVDMPEKTGTENSMTNASNSFAAGNYMSEEGTFIHGADGDLEIGFKNNGNTGLWCIWDNFQLVYYGASVDLSVLEGAYNKLVEEGSALAGQAMNSAVKSDLDAALSLTPSKTADSYTEVNGKISAAVSAAKASVKNYQALQTALAAADGLNAKGKEHFNNDANVAALVSAYNNGSFVALTTEDQAAIDKAVLAATMASLEKGADLTGLINNAACTGSRGQKEYGWSVDPATKGNWPFVGSATFENWVPAASIPEAYFDYYQVIQGLPAGKYKITAEMKYDNAASDDETGVYASTGSSEVKGGTKAGVTGFQKCETPEITVNEGEDLRIGVKTFGTQSVGWTVIQNFTLTYEGEVSLDDMIAALSTAVSNAEALAAKPMNAAKATALANAVKKYKTASYTNAADYTTAIGEVNAAISDAEPSVKFYANVENALYAKEEAVKALDAAGQASFVTSAAPYVSAGKAGELDETLDYVAKIDAAYIAAVKAQTTPGADMTGAIVNPTINGSADGWSVTQFMTEDDKPVGGNGPLTPKKDAMEYWGGNAITRDAAKFNYYQVITGLKAGQYQLTVDAYNSLDNEEGAEFNVSCAVYANNESAAVDVEGKTFNPYTVNVTVAEGEDLVIGVKSLEGVRMGARWFVANNFRLTYVGVPAPVYEINISAGENGTVTAQSGNYSAGETVEMTATPNADYEFDGWYIGTERISENSTFTYTVGEASADIVAKFKKVVTYNVAISATEGGKVSSTGGAYKQDSNVSLRATVDDGYEFVGWFVNDELVSTSTRFSYTVGTADATIVAKFQKQVVNYTVAVSAGEGGTVFGAGEFAEGSTVTIDAVAEDGYEFVGWFSGDNKVSDVANYAFKLEANTSLAAKFEKIIVNFNVAVSAGEGGSVTGAGEFAENSTVTIEAIPDEGYDFVGWYDGDKLVTDAAMYSFVIKNNTTLTAKFEKQAPVIETHDVAIAINSFGYGTFSSNENVDFSESGVAAYIASACNGSTVALSKVNEVPAGQGVLLFKANGGNFKATATTAEFDEVGLNYFVAGAGQTIGATTADNWLNCILTVDAATKSKVGLYPLGASQKATIPAGKAYLCAPLDPAKVSSLSAINLIFDEDVTGADELTLDLESGKVFVNAAGVKSTKAVKGINITEDGKKIIK